MLLHKGGQINNVQLITGLRIAEMSQRQGGGGDMYKEWKLLGKGKKVRGGGGQGRCEWRSEAFVKIQSFCENSFFFFFFFFFGGGGRVGGSGFFFWGGGGQGGCEWRSEAFAKIQKINIFFFWGGGVRVDGKGEVKLL